MRSIKLRGRAALRPVTTPLERRRRRSRPYIRRGGPEYSRVPVETAPNTVADQHEQLTQEGFSVREDSEANADANASVECTISALSDQHLASLHRSFTYPSKRPSRGTKNDGPDRSFPLVTPSASTPAALIVPPRGKTVVRRPSVINPRLPTGSSRDTLTSPKGTAVPNTFMIVKRSPSGDSFISAADHGHLEELERSPSRQLITSTCAPSFDVGQWTYLSPGNASETHPSAQGHELSRVHSAPVAGPVLRDFEESRLPPVSSERLQELHPNIARGIQRIEEECKLAMQKIDEECQIRVRVSRGRGARFWLTFSAVFVTAFLSAVDLTIISPILPSIAQEMPRSNISPLWITSAFLATSASFQPLFGGLSDAIGRREALLLATSIFLAGSVVICAAQNMVTVVAGRGIQGLGGGGMTVVGQVIMSDVTTLAERGYFLGLTSIAFAIAAVAAPIAGGWFATFDWRVAFYINFPIGLIAIALILPLKLQVPSRSRSEKLQRLDLAGTLVLFASVTCLLTGLTNGGTVYPWRSAKCISTLSFGGAGMLIFLLIELVPTQYTQFPLLPAELFLHRTAAIGYALTFFHGILLYGATQGMVLFFENRGDSPLQAAINILPANVPSTPAAFVAGFIMAVTRKFKCLIIVCEALMTLGLALCVTLDFDSGPAKWASYQVIASIGLGALYAITLPPVQASLPAEKVARATGTFAFARSFGAVWGVSAFLIAFQRETGRALARIPQAKAIGLTGATAIDFVPIIKTFPPEWRSRVNQIFHRAFQTGVLVMIPFAAIGLLLSFFLKHVHLRAHNDSKYGLKGQTIQSADLEGSQPFSMETPSEGPQSASSADLGDPRHYDSLSLSPPSTPALNILGSNVSQPDPTAPCVQSSLQFVGLYNGRMTRLGATFPSASTMAISTATVSTWVSTLDCLRHWLSGFSFESPVRKYSVRRGASLKASLPSPLLELSGVALGTSSTSPLITSDDEAGTQTESGKNARGDLPSWRESMNELHRRTVEVERRYEALLPHISPSPSRAQ